MNASNLPASLGTAFSVAAASHLGVTPGRLRNSELQRPFRGVRVRPDPQGGRSVDPFELARIEELTRVRALGARPGTGQFFSHRSAALIWGAPLPHRDRPELHLSVHHPARSPRITGVVGHSLARDRCTITDVDGLPVTLPGYTWATLGALTVEQLVVVGDFFIRAHRPGIGRRDVGKPPLLALEELTEIVELGHWPGMPKLRRALPLLRADSWSPMESVTRVTLVSAGIPEPELNCDVFDENGRFLGCVDMLFRRYRVAVEYQGIVHAKAYAADIERVERLRAAGWIVIQVTSKLSRDRAQLVARVAAALHERGWGGSAAFGR